MLLPIRIGVSKPKYIYLVKIFRLNPDSLNYMTIKRNTSLVIFILGLMAALGPFSIDMYLPSFPAIAADLHTTIGQVTLSLSSYFIGLSAGQLLYGPLLDKYGRKKPVYAGLVLYLLASVGCMMSQSVDALIVFRLIQAIGGCAAGVAAVAMVRDLFPVEENAKVFSLLMLVIGASPMIAPTIGGYVTATLGWNEIFLILAMLAVIILAAVVFILPESYKPNRSLSLKPKPIVQNFWLVLKEPQFYTYALTGSIAFAGLFSYVAGSPMLFMKVYQVSEKTYGWIFAGLSVGFIGSSQVNSLLLRRFNSQEIIPVALIAQMLFGILFIVAALNNWLDLAGTLVMLFLILCCVGIINPNASALSIAPFTEHAGSASALMGALQLGTGAAASIGIGLFKSQTSIPLACVMGGSGIVASLVFFICRSHIQHPILTDSESTAGLH